MHYVIILRGPAGVGKSTISRLLAEKIRARVIHFDEVMDELGLDYIPGEKWIPLHKFLKADSSIIPQLRLTLKKSNLVLDGNFYHKKHLDDLIQHLNTPHFVFTLKAALNDCMHRDKTRTPMLGEKAVTNVFRLVSAFDFGIVINTKSKTPLEVVKEILFYLPAKEI